MAKPGRNARCPCGSGRKYKACCLTKDEAAETERLTTAQTARDERAAKKRQSLSELREAMLAKLSSAEMLEDGLDEASSSVVGLILAGKLDEAEAAARDLLVRYPHVPYGWDRLGMVYEKRGDKRQAADCYAKVIDFIRAHPGDLDAETIDHYNARIARLDLPAAG